MTQHVETRAKIEELKRQQEEAKEAAERAKYSVSLIVADKEWDNMTYDDIGSFSVTEGMLVVFDHEQRTVAGYAPGAWLQFEVSREDRLESTDDEPKDDDNDDASVTE